MSSIVRYLIHRPLLTYLLLVFVVAIAVATATGMRRLGYPRVDMERLTITTNYPGASPEDVEVNVTIKLEDALSEVEGLERFQSVSVENQSRVQVFIDPDAEDKDAVKRDVERVISAVSDLPPEVVDRPRIWERKADNWPTYEVALVYQDGAEAELYRHARRLKRRLMDLNPVSRVGETGVQNREIQIILNQEAMLQNQVSFEEVIETIQSNKIRSSGGVLESYTSAKGVITFSEFERPEELEKLVLRSNALGQSIRLGSVAQVEDRMEKSEEIVRYNGSPGVSLWVFKKSHADVIRTVEEIKAAIEDYKKYSAPEGMTFLSTYDSSTDTKDRLNIVYSNAIIGFILVLAVLFYFLDRRVAFWTALGIPTSISIAFIAIPHFGITINSISLCGLIVVLGMVVDDAIIVAESIYRCRESGKNMIDAAVEGLSLVIKPVFTMIATTMIAFAPIYFVPGTIGKFIFEIPTIVILMLGASLIEATTLLPAHLAQSKNFGDQLQKPPGAKVMTRFEGWYESFLRVVLSRKGVSAGVIFTFLIGGLFASYRLSRFEMFPSEQSHRIWVSGELETGASLAHTARKSRIAESILDQLPEGVVHSYRTQNGRSFDGWVQCSHCFMIKLALTPASQREMSAEQVKEFLLSKVKELKNNPFKKLEFTIAKGGPGLGQPIELRVIGNDNFKRQEVLTRVKEILGEFPLSDIKDDIEKGKDEIRLLPNYQELAASGLTSKQVASTIRTAVDGTIVSYLHTPEERIPFRVMRNQEQVDLDRPLQGIFIKNRTGNLVPVSRFVESTVAPSLVSIRHYNGDRVNKITASVLKEQAEPKAVYEQLRKRFEHFEKEFPGFRVSIEGEAQKSFETYRRIVLYTCLAIFTIFLLLTVQFNSFTQPLMVILAVPFGLVGVGLGFGFSGTSLSLMAIIGVLGMTGVVVNDSLIMVDFMNRLSKEGKLNVGIERSERQTSRSDVLKAVIDGARIRFRPIVLTTLTTLAGLVPTAYGWIGGFDSYVSPMVMAMTWGLFFGTVSVLVVIPFFYVIHWEISKTVKSLFRKKVV